jgi:hypothetical protein
VKILDGQVPGKRVTKRESKNKRAAKKEKKTGENK